MLPNERLAYSAIPERPALALPNGARLAVWVIVNVEEWDIRQTMPRTVITPPAGGAPMPDIPNWAWHEYGNRVGFWRMLPVFDECRIPAALAINGSRHCGLRADRAGGAGARLGVHGPRLHAEEHAEGRERARRHRPHHARRSRASPGERPRGWLGPGLTETWETPDLLAEAGYDYVCDWVLDDQPVVLKTRSGSDRQRALHAGVQRRGDDADPASQGVGVCRPRHRSVRAADARTRRDRRASWRSSCIPTSWARRIG